MRLFELFESPHVAWRPVEGWPKYEVSNTGLVRNASLQRLISPWAHQGRGQGTAYKRVTLRDKGKRLNARVHRLVANAFLNRPEAADQVDHIDGNGFNNHANNLEWVTGSENMLRLHSRSKDDRNVPNF